ncbi:DUF1501 domain-containing protein [Pelagicoccus mobilis]|uniref:DUF1501 domain-containing protein n=1 Tax=Pelagicoccus mobilis TaxID=415221 RepID=A0A934RYM2_9BACT|nr:DUF1501 domain-containing protein [Pelagicoccus mobilis]MBK1876249.1 DUF1501 domain-containing protein [Pelagicoccus mobilis]
MSCAAVGSTAFYSTLISLLMSNRVSAQSMTGSSGHKALVCLFLEGGNDSFNMVVPQEADEFQRYRAARTSMGLAPDQPLPITDSASGRSFGLHPMLGDLQSLYQSGELAFVCNTGTLIEPTTLAAFENRSARLPLGLFSHADQQMHWQTSTPDKRDSKGWIGRMADVLQSINEAPKTSMNISLSGTNILQSGNSVIPYTITNEGAIDLQFYGAEDHAYFKGAVDSVLEQEYQNLLQKTYSNLNREAIDLGIAFNAAVGEEIPFSTEFPDTELADDLRMIARSIAANGNLGQQRQTFLARRGGFDHHDDMISGHSYLMEEVGQAVGAFWAAIKEMGMEDQVVLFTASDFGRTLTSNGDGTDHGWGGNHFVLGGGINGGRFYGEYPENIGLGNDLDTGRGRLIPTTSVDQYFAEIALWLGVEKSDLSIALPNIERFYDLGSSSAPLGFWQ